MGVASPWINAGASQMRTHRQPVPSAPTEQRLVEFLTARDEAGSGRAQCAVSSMAEHFVYTERVGSSSLSRRTIPALLHVGS